eukprot:5794679-Amphidinium_carterae.1
MRTIGSGGSVSIHLRWWPLDHCNLAKSSGTWRRDGPERSPRSALECSKPLLGDLVASSAGAAHPLPSTWPGCAPTRLQTLGVQPVWPVAGAPLDCGRSGICSIGNFPAHLTSSLCLRQLRCFCVPSAWLTRLRGGLTPQYPFVLVSSVC